MNLTNQSIWITGASSGLGKQLAIDVAKAGATPVLFARNEDRLNEVADTIRSIGGSVFIYKLDLSKTADIEAIVQDVFEKVGKIDILVNNAGFAVFDYADKASIIDNEEMFAVNVLGLMAMTKAVIPRMKLQNRGHIINIASQAGKLATPKSSVYAASKHAVLGYTNALRLELAEASIFVTAINPGPIRTPFFERADEEGTYVKNIENIMLTPEYVSKKIIAIMKKPKRELNLPKWMGVASKMYQLMPTLFEKIAGKKMRQK
ncbi:SDR family NAD(P)-dependent oxidoreductase [Bacillus sp. FJAT-45037]|uniref:SDR family NAD(P)-dependent oxidoreductase n=1 Tax=Bacillus sp. FJAT-45037 TaxID=2011007 RepID=UPI000C238BA2|nr:SDR family oxidoreductase [Bacillus sp. FJAT-45037]